ncbi:ATP/GTP-binding site motif A (P-loop) :Porin, alpha proteobacteria type [Brucella suis bv. 2]|nr:ATP/GTP-binding site motif A (P-loop) :Porin, alpha proteobacteria type [Brucella suis bv. 2]
MNIKSLLLGSAAALVAASGAQAADAIVAPEPEAVEYVRVCDAYGAGYFYIPGTETCLRVHGYVRYDVKGGDDVYSGTDRNGWDKSARFALFPPVRKPNSAPSRPSRNCASTMLRTIRA